MSFINLKLAVRNLGSNKLYTFINISGLSIACAFCILTFWYVKNEQSFDNFHKEGDRLFRIEQTNLFGDVESKAEKHFLSFLTKDNDQKNLLRTPFVLAGDLKANFPQIQNVVRISSGGSKIIRVGNEGFRERDGNFASVDPDFFTIFNYPILYGNAQTALKSPNGIVISERAAKKYFGYSNPIGRKIEVPDFKSVYTVSAVAKNFPTNSSFQFDLILPLTALPSYSKQAANPDFNYVLVIKMKEGVDIPRFKKELLAFSKIYYASRVQAMHKYDSKSTLKSIDIFIRPIADAHYNQSSGWDHYTSLKNIYQFIFCQ